jgi:hypothetical protein
MEDLTIVLDNIMIMYDSVMTGEEEAMPKTDNMTAAGFRNRVGRTMSRVQFGREHVRVWRYGEAQGVAVPEDWYERACEALGEMDRLNRVEPEADK